MRLAARELGDRLRPGSGPRTRAWLALAISIGLSAILVLAVADAALRTSDLDDRRQQALESPFDPLDVAGPAADAFRAFRATLGGGDRFALVFAADIDRDQQGLYRLVSLSGLYPPVATSDLSAADAVMVFGAPSPDVRRAFEEAGVVGGVWLGRRRS